MDFFVIPKDQNERQEWVQYLELVHEDSRLVNGEIDWLSLHLMRVCQDLKSCTRTIMALKQRKVSLKNCSDLCEDLVQLDAIIEKTDVKLFNCLKRHELWPSLVSRYLLKGEGF